MKLPILASQFRLKLTLAATTGVLASLVSVVTEEDFFFVWYMLAILALVLILFAWAATELWKDYGKRN